MKTVLLDISMSVDGFIAQPDDSAGPIHEWYFTGGTVSKHNDGFQTLPASSGLLDELFERTGALVTGRRTYDFVDGWGGNHPVAGVPVIVVTHQAPDVVPQGATPFTFVTDGVESAVAQAMALAGDKEVVVFGGASIARQCLSAGVVDEVQIHLVPVLLGQGVRLFDDVARERVQLDLIRVVDAPDVTHLRYRVVA